MQVSSAFEYMKCAKFGQGRFNGVNKGKLNTFRWMMLIPNLLLLAASLVTSEVMWFLYYYTYWGFLACIISLIASIRAAKYPETWQQTAVVASEVSLAMNSVLTLLFWTLLGPIVFNELEWSGIDLFLRF